MATLVPGPALHITPSRALSTADLQFLHALDSLGRRRLARFLQSPSGTAPASAAERAQVLAAATAFGAVPPMTDRWQQSIAELDLAVCWPEGFPLRLRAIPDPPWALYRLGDVSDLEAPAVAMVGSRRATARGEGWTEHVAESLSRAGVRVVSGLALGIDGAAHRGALQARSATEEAAPTLAVLGSGLALPTPRRHAGLAKRIVDLGGALLSEYAPREPARPAQFPERNRLVTGLAEVLIVVEANLGSGSMVSARLALEQGREVLAVPGPVGFPSSAGCHALIRDGAVLVESADQILEQFERAVPGNCVQGVTEAGHRSAVAAVPEDGHWKAAFSTDRALARQLYETLGPHPESLTTLCARVQSEPARVAHVLTLLELNGWVRRRAGGYYR
ncbi:MAG: DNA-processing protein DprA [Pseudomonadota bacterium]